MSLDLVHTVAFAGLLLFIGYALRRVVTPLARYNIPAPVIGGLLVAVATALARRQGLILFQFDTTLQAPLMIAFFATIEQAGVTGAATLAVAAAMVGIVSGGLMGGPIGTFLVERHRLRAAAHSPGVAPTIAATDLVEERLPEPPSSTPAGEDVSSYALLKAVVDDRTGLLGISQRLIDDLGNFTNALIITGFLNLWR